MNVVLKNLLNNEESRKDNNSSPPFMRIRAEKQDRPLPWDLLEQQDIPYGDPSNELMANVVYPRNGGAKRLPVIVFVHGGALVTGDRNSDRVFCQELARHGLVVYSIEYRLIDRADAFGMISDVCAALAMVGVTLSHFGGDPHDVSICAESAGAFLSIYAAAAGVSERIRTLFGCRDYGIRISHLILISGMIYTNKVNKVGLVFRKQLYEDKRKDRDFMAQIAPDNPQLLFLLPPIFLISSRADFLRSDTLKYRDVLDKYGHEYKLMYFDEGKELTHAFPALLPSLPESMRAMDEICRWLCQVE
ncbi:MAG: alpha/beta hydrolase [Clostridia bacterium]|nr:alpha/beta hydrolase [Clostridia bacterium]